jgi:hypothetical protein
MTEANTLSTTGTVRGELAATLPLSASLAVISSDP